MSDGIVSAGIPLEEANLYDMSIFPVLTRVGASFVFHRISRDDDLLEGDDAGKT